MTALKHAAAVERCCDGRGRKWGWWAWWHLPDVGLGAEEAVEDGLGRHPLERKDRLAALLVVVRPATRQNNTSSRDSIRAVYDTTTRNVNTVLQHDTDIMCLYSAHLRYCYLSDSR